MYFLTPLKLQEMLEGRTYNCTVDCKRPGGDVIELFLLYYCIYLLSRVTVRLIRGLLGKINLGDENINSKRDPNYE